MPEHKDVYIVLEIVYNFDAIMVIEQNLTNCGVVSSVDLEKEENLIIRTGKFVLNCKIINKGK